MWGGGGGGGVLIKIAPFIPSEIYSIPIKL